MKLNARSHSVRRAATADAPARQALVTSRGRVNKNLGRVGSVAGASISARKENRMIYPHKMLVEKTAFSIAFGIPLGSVLGKDREERETPVRDAFDIRKNAPQIKEALTCERKRSQPAKTEWSITAPTLPTINAGLDPMQQTSRRSASCLVNSPAS